MLDIEIDRRAQLQQSQADQAANDAALQELEASKSEASRAGREAFAEWKEEHEWRATERERLTVAIEALQIEIAAIDVVETEGALHDRYRARKEANVALAERIKRELTEINARSTELLRDVALAALEDVEINANLPCGLEPLVSANAIARTFPGYPRQDIGVERLSLWVRSDNGALIGDQAAVTDLGIKAGKSRGVIESKHRSPINCSKAEYEQSSFHPEIPATRSSSLWGMRLLDADSPAVAFDGTEISHPQEVLRALDRLSRRQDPIERPIQKELRPVGR